MTFLPRRSLRLNSTDATAAPALDDATSRKGNSMTTAMAAVTVTEVVPKKKGKVVPKTVPEKRRASTATKKAAAAAVNDDEDGLPTPATPPPRKRRAGRVETPPPRLEEGREPPRHTAIRRLADPQATNAQLLSPETSRVVSAVSLDFEVPSPTKAKSTATTTTDNLLQIACQHLIQVDARMEPLIASRECRLFTPEGLAEQIDPFESLASSIISQQVSGAAAKAIKERFLQLFVAEEKSGDEETNATAPTLRFPHPSQVAKMPLQQLRSAGLSQRKAEYVQGLAGHFVSGQLSAQLLADAPFETLMERLLEVRGLGRWSVEMFALFGLKRMDVFSVGDLGVQRGMAAFIGRDVSKLKKKATPGTDSNGKKSNKKWRYMTDTEMETMAEPFRPYRSLFMWYMWQVESTDVSTLEV